MHIGFAAEVIADQLSATGQSVHLIEAALQPYRQNITAFSQAVDQTADLKKLVAPAHHRANTLMRARGLTAWDLDDVKKVDLDLWSEISLLDRQIDHQELIMESLEETQLPLMKALLMSIASTCYTIARAQLGPAAAAGDVICAAYLGSSLVREARIDATPFEASMCLTVDLVLRSRAGEICVDLASDDMFAAMRPATITDNVMLRDALAAVEVVSEGRSLPFSLVKNGVFDGSPRTLL